MKVFLLLILTITALFSEEPTLKQKEIIKIVKAVAKTIPDKNGKTHEDIMCGICLTESTAGENIIGDIKKGSTDLSKGSLGIMQVKLSTARFLGNIYSDLYFIKKMDDKALIHLLLNDPVFSTKIATRYFVFNKNRLESSFKGISLYNGGGNNVVYYNRVKKNMGRIEDYS